MEHANLHGGFMGLVLPSRQPCCILLRGLTARCAHVLPAVDACQGHCLLVGVGGSGKQSLARLAAAAAGASIFETTLTRGYDEAAFREDLKALYGRLGGPEGKSCVFLFTDAHVVDEGFLELINNMLTSGDGLAGTWAQPGCPMPTRWWCRPCRPMLTHVLVLALATLRPPIQWRCMRCSQP